MRFAVISDVHGNGLALDAVLTDIAVQGVDATLCLGDHVSGPMDPGAVAERLMGLSGSMIRGNHDRWVSETEPDALDPVDGFARAKLAPRHLLWLSGLPDTAVFNGEVFLCHGTPQSDTEVWLDNYWQGRQSTLPDPDTILGHAAGIDYPIILCGHTHIARSVRLPDGRRIINPGSVGLQLVHGSPDARYAIIERRAGRWLTSIRVVEYDCAAAARQAVANGFKQWAPALATGWVGPEGLF
ncbi:metallophosphoesterase family protein [Devosia rhodophyticola]|uniref:Metallophosphoesterase family protein n=1 Tax=Devosia rhodophyticola TaxID=3026423 RepID=A0ABY7YVK4_9HYPH|nr:metallophosphoesterase family protein [Devosia rhodophyticola]WDR05080.1 metallophosphoesterase family protein [Devosia rhodophyticola]